MADSAEVVIRLVEGPAGGPAPVSQAYPPGTSPLQPAARTGPSSTAPAFSSPSQPAGTSAPGGMSAAWVKGIREEAFARIIEFKKRLAELDAVERDMMLQERDALKQMASTGGNAVLRQIIYDARLVRNQNRKDRERVLEELKILRLSADLAVKEEIETKEPAAALAAAVKARLKAAQYDEPSAERDEEIRRRAGKIGADIETRAAREREKTTLAQRRMEEASYRQARSMRKGAYPGGMSPAFRRAQRKAIARQRKLDAVRHAPPVPVKAATPRGRAMLAAQRRIERERQKRMEEEEYRRYPDAKPPGKGPGAVQLTQQLGMPGVSGIIGAAMTGNPVAIGMAAFTTAIDNAEKGVKHFGEVAASIAAGDAMGLSRSLTGLANQIPVVGGIMASAGNAILDISEGLMAQGRRISQYSAGLATQFAEYDVRQLMRDIRRANDPDIQRGVQAAMEFRDRMNDLLDRHMPEIVKVMEGGLNALLGIFKFVSQFMPAIARNTERTPDSAASDAMFVQLFDHPQAGLDRRNDMPMNQAGNQMPPGLAGL